MKIFLSTHGNMASGMKSSLEVLLGDASCLTVYDAYVPGDNSTVADEVEKFLAQVPEEELKILASDIKGGSVHQQEMKFMGRKNVVVMTGVNLVLLMSLVSSADEELTLEEIDEFCEDAKSTLGRTELEVKQSEEAFF